MTPVTFCGRTFTAQEVELMRLMAHDYAGLGVTEIARTVCELLEWKRPNGGLKNHECRLKSSCRIPLDQNERESGANPRHPRGAEAARECAGATIYIHRGRICLT